MELELKEINERPLALFIFIAILVHVIIGVGVWYYLATPSGQKIAGLPEFTPADVKNTNSGPQEDPAQAITGRPDDEDDDSEQDPKNPIQSSENDDIPPFEQSDLNAKSLNKSTFLHEKSGLLFADEIKLPELEGTVVPERKIIEPEIDREFKISNLPTEFRDREWSLTLRLKVNKKGYPDGRIRVIKSSGNAVLDQVIITRVEGSTFEPAHYEGTDNYIDYTFDLKIDIE